MSEEVITFNVVYNVQNIDTSIRQTQRMLLFTNALRLSIVDIQKVMSGPTIANVLFTAIQLTRVWTTLLRVIRATNAAQTAGVARGLAGRGAIGGAARFGRAAVGQGVLQFGVGGALGVGSVTQTGLMASLSAFAAANPVVIAGLAVGLAVTGSVGLDMRNRRIRNEWLKEQRTIAWGQGVVY